MKRRLMSAILSIAMIVSLFTVTFVNPVGAAAETSTYVNDRAALKDVIRTLYSKGPAIASTIPSEYFVNLGIITDADWNDINAKNYYVIEQNRKDFDASLAAKSANTLKDFFVKDYTSFLKIFGDNGKDIIPGKVVWRMTPAAGETMEQLIISNIEAVIKYASYIYYFGQNEDDVNVDPSFNEARNIQVKDAITIVNTVLTGLKDQIAANADKPAKYAEDFMGVDYKGFLTAAYKYHPSLGVNPFYNITAEFNSSVNPWAAYYSDNYYGSLGLTPVKWYTFEEIRANADWNKLLVAFEFELRKIHTATGTGILYADFVNGDKAAFNASFDALCKAILNTSSLTNDKYDMSKEIKSYLKLKKVIEIYSLYIKDLYNNIYTAPDMELLSNVLIASRFVEFVNDEYYKVLALKYAGIDELANKIIASMAAFTPRNEQVLDSASIAAGIKAIKEAKALVASWPQTDANVGVRDALITAAANLEGMLPIDSNGKVIVNVAKDVVKMKNPYDVEIGNDKFSVTFTPNYFAFIKFKALLDTAITNFTNKIFGYTIDVSLTGSKTALKDILNKYGYLSGVVGNLFAVDSTGKEVSAKISNLTKEYASWLFDAKDEINALVIANPNATVLDLFEKVVWTRNQITGLDNSVTSIYEKVIGYIFNRNNGFASGVAVENVWYFLLAFKEANQYYFDQITGGFDHGYYTDWESGKTVVKNGFDLAAQSVKDALAFLTKDLTVYLQTVKYNLENLVTLFNLDKIGDNTAYYAINAANISAAADGRNYIFENNYPKDYFDRFVSAANSLKNILLDTIVDANTDYNRATASKVIAAEKALVAATKALLSDLGDARLDAYLADVQKASSVNYGTAGWNYESLSAKLNAAGVVPTNYILTTTPRNYDYFAFTLDSVANWNDIANYYAFNVGSAAGASRFELNFLNAFNSALAISTDASGYARDAAEKATALMKVGYTLKQAIVITTDGTPKLNTTIDINSDMPLWYAQKLLADIQGIPAMLSANSVGVIAAAKAAAGGLNELLDKAAALNVYDYIVGENKDYDKVWEAFMNAYNAAVKVSYDKTVPLADIDAAVKALSEKMAALESIKRPEDGEVITVDDFKAAIAKAEATLARYDLAEDLDAVNTLKEVVNAANKLLTYNISVITAGELKTEIAKLNDAVKAVFDVIYVGDALKADVEAEAAGVDANAYTEASYKAFKDAVDAALAIAAKEDSKVSESKAALEAVKAAKAALATKPVIVDSDTRKEAISTYDKAVSDFARLKDYSEESMANLKTAIDNLKAGIDANASDAQLIDLIVKLRLANAALMVVAPITLDD